MRQPLGAWLESYKMMSLESRGNSDGQVCVHEGGFGAIAVCAHDRVGLEWYRLICSARLMCLGH